MKRILSVLAFSPVLLAIISCNDAPHDDNKGNKTILNADKESSLYDTAAFSFSENKLYVVIMPDSKVQDSSKLDENWNKTLEIHNRQSSVIREFLEKKGYREYNIPERRIWAFNHKNGEFKVNKDTLQNDWGVLIYTENDSVFIYRGNNPQVDLAGI